MKSSPDISIVTTAAERTQAMRDAVAAAGLPAPRLRNEPGAIDIARVLGETDDRIDALFDILGTACKAATGSRTHINDMRTAHGHKLTAKLAEVRLGLDLNLGHLLAWRQDCELLCATCNAAGCPLGPSEVAEVLQVGRASWARLSIPGREVTMETFLLRFIAATADQARLIAASDGGPQPVDADEAILRNFAVMQRMTAEPGGELPGYLLSGGIMAMGVAGQTSMPRMESHLRRASRMLADKGALTASNGIIDSYAILTLGKNARFHILLIAILDRVAATPDRFMILSELLRAIDVENTEKKSNSVSPVPA